MVRIHPRKRLLVPPHGVVLLADGPLRMHARRDRILEHHHPRNRQDMMRAQCIEQRRQPLHRARRTRILGKLRIRRCVVQSEFVLHVDDERVDLRLVGDLDQLLHPLAALRREAIHVERPHNGKLLVHVDPRHRAVDRSDRCRSRRGRRCGSRRHRGVRRRQGRRLHCRHCIRTTRRPALQARSILATLRRGAGGRRQADEQECAAQRARTMNGHVESGKKVGRNLLGAAFQQRHPSRRVAGARRYISIRCVR